MLLLSSQKGKVTSIKKKSIVMTIDWRLILYCEKSWIQNSNLFSLSTISKLPSQALNKLKDLSNVSVTI